MADQERIKARLNNIRSVEPILGAMRTISLGSWQAAVNRRGRLRDYSERLKTLLPALIPHLHAVSHAGRGALEKPVLAGMRWLPLTRRVPRPETHAVSVVLVIGSERGLCGAFNSSLVQYAAQVLDAFRERGARIELAVLGTRSRRLFERLGWTVEQFRQLPMTTLPPSGLARELTRGWLERFEAWQIDSVDVIYNAYRGLAFYRPVTLRLIPPVLLADQAEPPWPPPYVDTAPMALYARVMHLWVTTEMYRVLLDSASAEHSARYQLMEGATQNSERLIDELTLALQSARRGAITAEMQELAVGAGLLGNQS